MQCQQTTYVHINHLPIALRPAYTGGHHHELVIPDEVADASFLRGGVEVEFQGGRELHEDEEEREECPRDELRGPHRGGGLFLVWGVQGVPGWLLVLMPRRVLGGWIINVPN